MLWLEKYRPKTLDEINTSPDGKKIKQLSKNMPNILFYGSNGCGKLTRCLCLMAEIYKNNNKLVTESVELQVSGKRTSEFIIKKSTFYTIINIEEAYPNEQYIIDNQFKLLSNPEFFVSNIKFKTIILTKCQYLQNTTQQYLRKMMERCSETLRIIMITNSYSKLIPALRSRMFPVRVSAVTEDEMLIIAKKIIKQEKVDICDLKLRYLIKKSDNIRSFLLRLNIFEINKNINSKFFSFTENEDIDLFSLDWEKHIQIIVKNIMNNPTGNGILNCRNKCYELISNCIRQEEIINAIHKKIISDDYLNNEDKMNITKISAKWDAISHTGNKKIFHIEACIAEMMFYFHNRIVE